jgi:hypothetical protein
MKQRFAASFAALLWAFFTYLGYKVVSSLTVLQIIAFVPFILGYTGGV